MSNDQHDSRPFAGSRRIPPDRSSFERRHGVARPDLFREAIEQLLSGFDPSDITPEEVQALEDQYGISVDHGTELRFQLWSDVFDIFFANYRLTSAERVYLDDLRRALDLDEGDVERMRLKVVAPRFQAALRDVVADRAITDEERASLAQLAAELAIPSAMAHEAVERTARSILDRMWHVVTADGRLTAPEATAIRDTARVLGIRPTIDQDRVLTAAEETAALEQARRERERALRAAREADRRRHAEAERVRLTALLARASATTTPPLVPAIISLLRSETCHLVEPTQWHELQVDPTEPFVGPRLTYVDGGTLHVTNQRLVFEGERTLALVRNETVTSITRHLDALRVHRRGASDMFLIAHPVERLDLISSVLAMTVRLKRVQVETTTVAESQDRPAQLRTSA